MCLNVGSLPENQNEYSAARAGRDLCGVRSLPKILRTLNVSFYEKFGFGVIEEAHVLATPNWFMSRAPGAHRVKRSYRCRTAF